LPEWFDASGLRGWRKGSQKTDPRELRFLLCLGGKAERKEHGAKRNVDKEFPHEFYSRFLPASDL
jgi:hypothetical protein